MYVYPTANQLNFWKCNQCPKQEKFKVASQFEDTDSEFGVNLNRCNDKINGKKEITQNQEFHPNITTCIQMETSEQRH